MLTYLWLLYLARAPPRVSCWNYPQQKNKNVISDFIKEWCFFKDDPQLHLKVGIFIKAKQNKTSMFPATCVHCILATKFGCSFFF